jgi:hypothetical protein
VSLIQALLNPAAYPHPVDNIELIETHISWVLLTGHYAYKIKKISSLISLIFPLWKKDIITVMKSYALMVASRQIFI